MARTLVMAVLNVTPDSFSDGGRWTEPELAVSHGLELVAGGADLIDVGGESTRPGASRPHEDEERRRVVDVVATLASRGVVVSVDTMRAGVARAAVEAGASIVNDVSGGLADPGMLPTVAELGVDYVAMHWRGHGGVMNQHAHYRDVVAEVLHELSSRREAALAAGIDGHRLVLDPGYGFAKDASHNWTLLAHQQRVLDQARAWGHRMLIGVSRKRFLGELLADEHGPRRADERDDATLAVTTLSALQGAWAVRTHTARPHRDAVEVVARLGSSPDRV